MEHDGIAPARDREIVEKGLDLSLDLTEFIDQQSPEPGGVGVAQQRGNAVQPPEHQQGQGGIDLTPDRALPGCWIAGPGFRQHFLQGGRIDLIGWLLGAEPTEVTALAGHEGGFDPETLALVLLRYGTGALAYVNVNQSVAFPQADITVYGTKGRVVGRSCTRMNMEGTLDIVTEQGETTIETASYHAYRGAVMAFEEAVAAGREPSPSGLDGLRSVALTSAIAESLRDGRAIAVTA